MKTIILSYIDFIGHSGEKCFDWFPDHDGVLDLDFGIPYVMNGGKHSEQQPIKPATENEESIDGEQIPTKRNPSGMQEEKAAMKKEYFEIRRRLGPDFNPTGW